LTETFRYEHCLALAIHWLVCDVDYSKTKQYCTDTLDKYVNMGPRYAFIDVITKVTVTYGTVQKA